MRLLIIRTSAMGDVALVVPVIKGMREHYPDVELVLVTRPAFAPFFQSIEGVTLIYPDLGERHKRATHDPGPGLDAAHSDRGDHR
jgi:ADP-heptose:LPS heptosyltransferase